MALSLASTTATAPDFSTVVSGFTADMQTRVLVNNGQGRYQLAQIDDTTMRLIGKQLTPGVDRVVIETVSGFLSGGRVQEAFDITVTLPAAVAAPSITLTPPAFGVTTVSVTPTVANMPGGVVYALRDAVSQQTLRPSDAGLTLDTATGALTGTLAEGAGYVNVVLVALQNGVREVARSAPFSLYNPTDQADTTSFDYPAGWLGIEGLGVLGLQGFGTLGLRI